MRRLRSTATCSAMGLEGAMLAAAGPRAGRAVDEVLARRARVGVCGRPPAITRR